LSLYSYVMNRNCTRSDNKRDAGLTTPDDVVRYNGISYGPHRKWNILELYVPKEAQKPLPLIVSIHGGGYVYGTIKTYQFYCMSLAQRGFAVINFNYRLAPKYKFPAPLEDTNAVMQWAADNAEQYGLDMNNVFMVGDSAGAQLLSQYAAMWSDKEYAKLFGITPPDFRLAAVGLNCGMYDLPSLVTDKSMKYLKADYLGKNARPDDPRYDVFAHIGGSYPPAYLLSSEGDFLRDKLQPMLELLRSRGIEAEGKIYGTAETYHVFHVNLRDPYFEQANADQTDFFKKYIRA